MAFSCCAESFMDFYAPSACHMKYKKKNVKNPEIMLPINGFLFIFILYIYVDICSINSVKFYYLFMAHEEEQISWSLVAVREA